MAEDPKVKPDRQAAAANARGSQSDPTREVDAEEVRYTLDELKAAPRLLGSGISPHAVEGALVGASRKSFTLAQAADELRTFLGRPLDNQPAEVSS